MIENLHEAGLLPALVSLSIGAALLSGLIAYEAIRFAYARARVRHTLEAAGPAGGD